MKNFGFYMPTRLFFGAGSVKRLAKVRLPQGTGLIITGGLGFLLAIVLFASIRERLVFADYPKAFEGFPIALVTAGLMALAFMGFSGLKVW